MKQTHTPGPWTVRETETDIEIRHEPSFITVCEMSKMLIGGDGEAMDAARADARLIAKAPEMREALEALLGCGRKDLSNPKYDGYYSTARALLATIDGTDDKGEK